MPIKNTRQTHCFAECQTKTLGKNISLPSVNKKHSATTSFCRVSNKNTRQKYQVAECQPKTYGKPWLCRVSLTDTRQSSNGRAAHPTAVTRPPHVPVLCRVSVFAECFVVVCQVFFIRHSAKLRFAECYMFAEC